MQYFKDAETQRIWAFEDDVIATEENGVYSFRDARGGLLNVPATLQPHNVVPPTEADILAQLKEQAIARVRTACSEAIQSGVVCDALGAAHTYPTRNTPENPDQQNLDATVMAARIDGEEGAPYKFWCMSGDGVWARREHTAAQIIAVGKAVRAHVVAQQDHYEQKLIEIKQATAETIATITW